MNKAMTNPVTSQISPQLGTKYFTLVQKSFMKIKKMDELTIQELDKIPIFIERDESKEILNMLAEVLAEFRLEMMEAQAVGDINTLYKIAYRTYGDLCYTPTPQLKAVFKRFISALSHNIRELEFVKNCVLYTIDAFEIALQSRK